MSGENSNMKSQSSIAPTAVTNSSSSESLTTVFHKREAQMEKNDHSDGEIVASNDVIQTKDGCSVTNELAAASATSLAEKQSAVIHQFESTNLQQQTIPPINQTSIMQPQGIRNVVTTTNLQQPTIPPTNQTSIMQPQGIRNVVTTNFIPQQTLIQHQLVAPLQPMNHIPFLHSESVATGSTTVTTPVSAVPEFLYQLSKMLTDNNRDIIEWNHGKIEVHSPHRLESEVLKKYFRHSKFASFQRQLNYFGFRKQAGKGKMAPCSYVNDAAGLDVNSLLHIKRKSTLIPEEKNCSGKKSKPNELSSITSSSGAIATTTVNPVLAGILNRNKDSFSVGYSSSAPAVINSSHNSIYSTGNGPAGFHAIAQTAVGRGIRHNIPNPLKPLGFPTTQQYEADSSTIQSSSAFQSSSTDLTQNTTPQIGNTDSRILQTTSTTSNTTGVSLRNADSLTQLENNFLHSYNRTDSDLFNLVGETEPTPLYQMGINSANGSDSFLGFLSRNSSLVDLAMLVPVQEGLTDQQSDDASFFDFIDFPNPELFTGEGSSI